MFPSISRPRGRPFVSIATFAPRVDVYEANGDLVVKAEIPGVKKDEVKITLDEGDLVLEGERKAETEVKEENYYRLERAYGSFYRRIPVPFEVKAEKVKTRFADGVLEVRIPMPAEAKPQSQSIPIG
jgi:HSP20 family protein